MKHGRPARRPNRRRRRGKIRNGWRRNVLLDRPFTSAEVKYAALTNFLNAVLLGIPSTPIERSDEDAAQQGTVDPGATPTTPPRS